MPITRLQRHTALRRKTELKRLTTVRANKKARAAEKKKSLTTSDWKKFCDICFEFYIRWRDNWIDGIDGKIYQPGDYEHYHACHYISLGSLATRYLDINCHGQSSGHNYAMSPKAPTRVRRNMEKLYRAWMVKTYSEEEVAELESHENDICRRTDYDWYMQARECFAKAARQDSARLQERLNKLYKTTLQKRTLELIQQKLSGDYNE